MPDPVGRTAVVVATLNVRNTADDWRQRAPLLVEQLAALDPDVIGLQEVRRLPGQARRIARQASAGSARWTVRAEYKSGIKGLSEGIAVLSRLPVIDHDRLALGSQSRVAQRVTVGLPDGRVLDVYNVHLANRDSETRLAQARRLLAWIDERPDRPLVLVGDFNSRPDSAPWRMLTGRLRSAYSVVHGSEPRRTLPAGPVLDYIFVNDLVRVHEASITFDRPSADDPGLLPSDHFGLVASLSLMPSR